MHPAYAWHKIAIFVVVTIFGLLLNYHVFWEPSRQGTWFLSRPLSRFSCSFFFSSPSLTPLSHSPLLSSPPFRHYPPGFFITQDILYPDLDDTVSTTSLTFFSLIGPGLIMIGWELSKKRKGMAFAIIAEFLFFWSLCLFATQVLKNVAGRYVLLFI